jgi:UDP-N-acetylglucosamine 2-epimerase (non-hydrolysing)
MMKIFNIVGARPNFMKIAPLQRAMQAERGLEPKLIHTGQHYDERMSDLFFRELGLPEPDVYLGVGSGSHARQTAAIMTAFEDVVNSEKPELVLVVGDVNSTAACSLVAKKLQVPVAHVEAGLRSYDRSMPEEINRLVTDAISDLFFTSEKSGSENLLREGAVPERVHHVGNVMIDSLVANLDKAAASSILNNLNLQQGNYILVTLHRPANVDDEAVLSRLVKMFVRISKEKTMVLPLHPRTLARLQQYDLLADLQNREGIEILEPLGYLDFLALQSQALGLLTDSGGVQEESTFLGLPCITMRENTERPSTVELGTNVVAGRNVAYIEKLLAKMIAGEWKEHRVPPLWDGHAAERIVKILLEYKKNEG